MTRTQIPPSVLLVEEDPGWAELVQRSLGRSGFVSQVAGTVAAALDLLRKRGFQAVVLDYQLPDGPSWPVLEAMARAPGRPVAIMLTALGDEQVAAEALGRGVSEYRVKSAGTLEELPALIERALRAARVEEARRLMSALVESAADAIMALAADGRIREVNAAAAEMFTLPPAAMAGHLLTEFVTPASRETVAGALDPSRGAVALLVQGLRGDKTFDLSLTISPLPPGVVGWAVVGRDVSKTEEARREVEARLRQQAAVAEMGRLALAGLELKLLLQSAIRLAAEATGADYGLVLELEPPVLRWWASYGLEPEPRDLALPDTPEQPGMAWFTFRHEGPVLCQDTALETRFHSHLGAFGVRSGLSVALPEGLGIMGLASRSPGYFHPNDGSFLESMAQMLGFEVLRRRSQQSLADFQLRLDTLIQQSPLGIAESDPRGRVTMWNRAAERILGYPAEEAIGMPWAGFVPPRDRDRMNAALQRVLEEGAVSEVSDVVTRMGHLINCEWHSSCLVNRDGETIGLATLFRDVTAARRAEDERRKLWLALEQSPLAVLISDTRGRVAYANPRFAAMSGFGDDELLGMRVARLLRDPQPQESSRALRRTLAAGEVWRGELGARRRSGDVYYTRTVIAPVRSAVGRITDYVTMAEEITEQKVMERRLAEAEAKYAGIFRDMHDGFARTDRDGVIQLANPAANRLLGYGDGELVGVPASSLFSDPDAHSRLLDHLGVAGRAEDVRLAVRRKDGSLRTFEGCFRAVAETGGNEVIFRDVTDRLQAEEERQARLAADSANRLKSQFLAHMSHEIRTPLNAILGLCHLTLATPLEPRQRDYQTKLRQAGRSLLRIVDDVLDLSKIEADRLGLERVTFNVRQLLSAQLELVAVQAAEKGLDLRLEVAPEVPERLKGDPGRLGQVLLNLLSNAVKFTSAGQVCLSVGARTVTPPCLEFLVTDTGLGIAPALLPQLFEPFQQADSSTTRQFGGSGLGLAICRRLVALMGGEITVESEPGEGSRFRFTALLEAPSEECQEAVPGPSAGNSGALAPGSRVLLVEDNPINQQIARELLESAGLQVEVAADGSQAVERVLGAEPPALVLMDLQMPVMDGYTAAARIRERASAEQLPIIALTAHALSEERERCRQAGMNDYVAKPIEPEILFGVLKRWLPIEVPAAPPQEACGPDLPGLDFAGGLRRMAGDREAYLRILASFAEAQRHEGEEMAALAARADWAAVRARAHALKGASANLGLHELASLAAAAEREPGAGTIERLLEGWHKAAEQLRRLAVPAGPVPAAAGGLSDFSLCLAQGDPTALELLGPALLELRALGAAGPFRRLEEMVLNFDFEAARQELARVSPGGH